MQQKALIIEPDNPLYQWIYYMYLDTHIPGNKESAFAYAKMVLAPDSPIRKNLEKKGALGEYILSIMMHWTKRILNSK